MVVLSVFSDPEHIQIAPALPRDAQGAVTDEVHDVQRSALTVGARHLPSRGDDHLHRRVCSQRGLHRLFCFAQWEGVRHRPLERRGEPERERPPFPGHAEVEGLQ